MTEKTADLGVSFRLKHPKHLFCKNTRLEQSLEEGIAVKRTERHR